jgi:hypothetical protein
MTFGKAQAAFRGAGMASADRWLEVTTHGVERNYERSDEERCEPCERKSSLYPKPRSVHGDRRCMIGD